MNLHYHSESTVINYCTRCGTKEKWNVIPNTTPLFDDKCGNGNEHVNTPLENVVIKRLEAKNLLNQLRTEFASPTLTDEPFELEQGQTLSVMWPNLTSPVYVMVDGNVAVKVYPGEAQRIVFAQHKRTASVGQVRKNTKPKKRTR